MGAGGVWGTERGSRREGSTPETEGSPPLDGPPWYLPAPVGTANYGNEKVEEENLTKTKN